MRRTLGIGLLILVCAVLVSAGALGDGERVRVQYFYMNVCESCHPEEDFKRDFFLATGKEPADYDYSYYNVYQQGGKLAYEEATAHLADAEKGLPLLIVGSEVYSGTTAIETGMRAEFGELAQDGRSVIYFLTTTACESCAQARETIESLPATIAVRKGEWVFGSEIEVREINIAVDPSAAIALFDRYGIPDERRVAPSVFMGGQGYYVGAAEITAQLRDALVRGEALGTPELVAREEQQVVDAGALSGALVSGLVAGLNPCAISMLLMYAGLLLSVRRNLLLMGGLYMAGKLLVYLGIGFLFSYLWISYAPPWFPMAVRILMTVIAAVLVGLNVWDAHQARRSQLGKVRNQLPTGLRAGLRGIISRGVNKSGVLALASAFAIGAVVAGGEFLCAGQLYAAVLVANAQNPGANHALPLLVYCLAFALPSAVVLVAVALSRRTLEASDWMLRHMAPIKLATAAMLVLVVAYMWLA